MTSRQIQFTEHKQKIRRAEIVHAKIWCPFGSFGAVSMAPKQFPAFSGSSQTVFELGVSQTVSEFLQAAPRPFLNFLGRVQERGGQTQGVQRTPVGKPRVDHFGTISDF